MAKRSKRISRYRATNGYVTRALLFAAVCLTTRFACSQGVGLNPTRPTVANAATIQPKGILQIESGYDAYPGNPPGNQQTVDTLLTYAALDRLRLDFGWSAFNHQQQPGTGPVSGPPNATESINGIGTISLGGKVHLLKERPFHSAPAIGFQYEAELPTASRSELQGYGQQAILLVNHHYLKNGDMDVLLNASIVQSDCQTPTGCTYGGQQSVAVSYHLQKQTRLYAEVFAQNVSQSNTPPGTYFFGGFFRQISDSFGIDGGLRLGLSDYSSTIGTTVGIVFGKHVGHKPKV